MGYQDSRLDSEPGDNESVEDRYNSIVEELFIDALSVIDSINFRCKTNNFSDQDGVVIYVLDDFVVKVSADIGYSFINNWELREHGILKCRIASELFGLVDDPIHYVTNQIESHQYILLDTLINVVKNLYPALSHNGYIGAKTTIPEESIKYFYKKHGVIGLVRLSLLDYYQANVGLFKEKFKIDKIGELKKLEDIVRLYGIKDDYLNNLLLLTNLLDHKDFYPPIRNQYKLVDSYLGKLYKLGDKTEG